MKPSANDSGTPPRGRGRSSRRRLPRRSLSELLHFQYQQQHRQHDSSQERIDPNQDVCFLPLLNRLTPHGGETEAEQHQLLISVLEAALAITGTGGVCPVSPNHQEQESSPEDDEDHCTGSKPTFHEDDTATKKHPWEDKKEEH